MSTQPSQGAEPSAEEVAKKPWKYIGYEGYTNFIASDDDFYILRGFDKLNIRTALAIQDDISILEETLHDLDQGYSAKEAKDIHNGKFRDDVGDRTRVMELITQRLYNYNQFILQQTDLRRLPRASSRDIQNLRAWHFNHDHSAISPDEAKYLKHEKDLFYVVQRDKTSIRRLLDRSSLLRTLDLWRDKAKHVLEYDAAQVSYSSDRRLDNFASALVAAIGMTILIAPIWILQALSSLTARLVALIGFVVVFSSGLSFAMASKPFEALGATTA